MFRDTLQVLQHFFKEWGLVSWSCFTLDLYGQLAHRQDKSHALFSGIRPWISVRRRRSPQSHPSERGSMGIPTDFRAGETQSHPDEITGELRRLET
jgi:hypothetical protein